MQVLTNTNSPSNGYIFDLELDLPVLANANYLDTLEVTDLEIAHFNLPISEINEQYLNWISNLNLVIDWSEIFYCAPGSEIFIHSDDIYPEGCCKMNWSYGKSQVPISWYKASAPLTYRDNGIGGYYYACDSEDMTLDFSACVNNPSIIRVDLLHGVKNETSYPWWCVSIVLKEPEGPTHRVTWEQALIIFKNYQKQNV
jgi:hypothetical protein